MIRRFVNVVAKNIKSGMHSLHRLDVSKHLFYPSAAEAEAAAAAAAAMKRKTSGWAPQIPVSASAFRMFPADSHDSMG